MMVGLSVILGLGYTAAAVVHESRVAPSSLNDVVYATGLL